MCLRALDNPSSAVTQWEAVIVQYPGASLWDRAWENKAYTQWAYLDQYSEAQQTLLSFVASVPQHARAAEFLFDAARVAERDGRLAEASQLWERLVTEYPLSGYSFQALFLAGISEVRQGNLTAAQAVFLRAQETAYSSEERAAAALWVGKTYQALGDPATAQAIWQQAASLDPTGYYSERARDLIASRHPFSPPQNFDLGVDLQAERQHAETWMRATFSLPPETNLSGSGELAADARYLRGLEFWNLGMYPTANAEFNALRQAVENDPAASYRLANLLLELGAYRPAILAARQVLSLAGMDDAATLDAPIYFNHIRFGTYYRELVIPLAEEYDFTPFLVWSTMRQESLFERGIRSSVGARGLLQIMPATAQEINSRLGWPPNFTTADLDRPVVSIPMGLFYLDAQRDALDGNLYAALAAYNGGPGNAATWLRLADSQDPDLFLEIVRFDETRRYIKGIYEIFSLYRRLYERIP
ncbi:MAG: transglycosylase SLT domain-containing protein [Anaerolineales bacterium]|nr:transglycosylase SLT domain-containing protein [Anaerolineales bacterium]